LPAGMDDMRTEDSAMAQDTVFFTPWSANTNLLNSAASLYSEAGILRVIDPGDLVAIKLHAGERGNPNYVEPFLVRQIFDLVKKAGGKPFLTDTNTYYRAKRNNAVDHMETAEMNGFGQMPFIVADGLVGENYVEVPTVGVLDKIFVAGAVAKADAMIVVSHFKGHPLGGFGGAIKNLGMGCVAKETKLAQHRRVDIVVDKDKCTGCGTCTAVCWFGVPKVVDDCSVIDGPECMRCLTCLSNCPEGAITLLHRERLGDGLAAAAMGVLSTFNPAKVAFITFAKDIVELCDCLPLVSPIVTPDLGIFAGLSPLSIDASVLGQVDYNHLNTIHDTDCFRQIRAIKELGCPGTDTPEIIEVGQEK
jgi:uncharacterized Fe-S center protein